MNELIYMLVILVMTFGSIKLNNEVVIESSIQQVENVELGTFLCSKMGQSLFIEKQIKKL